MIKNSKKNIMVTGGAGFIGSNLVRLLINKYPEYNIINLDKLTYAGNLANLKDVEDVPNYKFVKADICDYDAVKDVIISNKINNIIHLAAESHVDRSIKDPFTFARTNVMGTLTLLQAAKEVWGYSLAEKAIAEKEGGDKARKYFRDDNGDIDHLFYHISTDEVYGALKFDGKLFTEDMKYDPHSPYSASKASSDHFVRAFHDTYGFPVVLTNCSNNYGPYQFPEKLIPLFLNNIRHNKPLPVYGTGENVRDWLYVVDHARAIDVVFHKGNVADTYNIGGFNEWKNIDIIKLMIKTADRLLGREEGASDHLITYVTDRAGHDLRYAIDSTKLKNELGWKPSLQFEEGIEKTIEWYLDHQEWMDHITSGNYLKYYQDMYGDR
ncbi:MAG: dTDP-glucose 4,6-dehydratase [Bacteroidales bacterium]